MLRSCLILLSLLVSVTAWANSRVVVTSLSTGQEPYVIVYKSSTRNDETKLEPGIYAQKKGSDDLTLLLPGIVTDVGGGFNGVIAQFPNYSKNSSREETLLILDGKLILFSNQSRAENKNSYIEFGSAENPLVDGLTGQTINLSALLETDSVQVHTTETANAVHLLVSIKQPNHFGTGVTFAAVLPPRNQQPEGELKFLNPPTIIDYNFLNKQELQNLVPAASGTTTDMSVVSRLHLLQLSRAKSGDNPIIVEWKQFLNDLDGKLKTSPVSDLIVARTSEDSQKIMPVPIFNVNSGNLHLTNYPAEMLTLVPFPIIYRVDPIQGHSGLFFNSGLTSPDQLIAGPLVGDISGNVEYDPQNKKFKFWISEQTRVDVESPNRMVLVSINGTLQAIFQSADGARILNFNVGSFLRSGAGLQSSQIKEISFSHRHIQRERKGLHHLVISYKTIQGETETVAFVLSETTYPLPVEGKFVLDKKFYPQAELDKRISVASKMFNGLNTVLFDQTAEPSSKIKTTPYTNLTTSNEKVRHQNYLLSLNNIDLYPPHLVYREFNPEGANSSKDGIYLVTDLNITPELSLDVSEQDQEDGVRHFVPGKILRKSKMKKDHYDLDSRLLLDTDAGDLNVHLFALDPKPEMENKDTFRLVFTVGGVKDNAKVRPTLHTIDLPFSFDRLQAAKIIHGRKSAKEIVSLVLFVGAGETEDTKANQPGVFIIPLKIDHKYQSNVAYLEVIGNHSIGNWVIRNELQPSELKDRIAFDTKGYPYWVVDPKIERHAANFKVFSLEKPFEPIAIHRKDTRVVLKSNEQLDGSEGSVSGFQHSNWLMYDPVQIVERFSEYKTHFEDIKKNKRKVKRRVLFSSLNEYLENLATPSDKKKHTVLLIEDKFKEDFMKYILGRLLLNEDGYWSRISNKGIRNFYPHTIDSTTTVRDVRSEMEILAAGKKTTQNLVFVDAATIFKAMGLQHPGEEKEAKEDTSEEDEESAEDSKAEGETKTAESKDKDKDKKEETKKEDTKETTTVVSTTTESKKEQTEESEDADDEELLAGDAPQFLLRALALEGRGQDVKAIMSLPEEKRFQVPTVIIASPQEWRALKNQLPSDVEDGVFETFEANAEFLTSSWTTWPAQSGRAAPEIKTLSQTPISKEEFQVFKELEGVLLKAVDKNAPAEHRIVVVPKELKGLVHKLILSRWASDNKNVAGAWNYSNPELALFKVDPNRPLQSKVFDNFYAMKGASDNRRPVLIGDLGDIIKIGRPSPAENQQVYRIKDPAITDKDLMNFEQHDIPIPIDKMQLPHLMWMIASEGAEVQPPKTEGWTLSSSVQKKIPTIILATEEEVRALKHDTAFEGRFVDWDKEFKSLNLQEPTTDIKIELLQGLFKRTDIESLNYKFADPDNPSMSEADARKAILGQIVSGTAYNAKNTEFEPTASFLRVFTEFRRSLTEDNELRRGRVLTPTYIKRLFERVFPIPLDYSTLDPFDKTRKLADPDNFGYELADHGYAANHELKRKVADAMNMRTRSTQAGRNVPNSIILFGGTSTGKTFLFQKLMEVIGSKEYKMDQPSNDDAGHIIVKVDSLTDEESSKDTKLTHVDKVLAHVENLLCQQNGARAGILFDDLHKAKTSGVLKKIIAFTERLFEAKNGIIRVECMSADGQKKEYREIPVRNITLVETINPTRDKEKKDKFEEWNDLESKIIAALSRSDYSLEDSYLARFSTKINMDDYPRDAKVESLARAIRDANRQEFGSGHRFVMVTPDLLDTVVEAFPKSNAREFLNVATHSLAAIPHGTEVAPLYIKDMSRSASSAESIKEMQDAFGKAKKIDYESIDEALQGKAALRPVTQTDISSKVEFMSVIINSFRVRMYEELLIASKEDRRLSQNPQVRGTILIAFIMAAISNVSDNKHVPLKRVRAVADDFLANNPAQRKAFEQQIGDLSRNDASFYRLNIPPQVSSLLTNAESFVNGRPPKPEQRTRRTVLTETAANLFEALKPLMAFYFRVQDVQSFSHPKQWFESLTDNDPKELIQQVSEKILEIYFKYRLDITHHSVLETFAEGQLELTEYDISRLFFLCLDRALVDLPWGQATQFTIDIADIATKQMQYGQIPEFQNFAFVSNFSPLYSLTPQNVMGFGSSVKEFREFSQTDKDALAEYYDNNCEKYLVKEGGTK